ncbi:hypothetical protein IAI18_06975 [Acetobacteraceae bacterium H6797]|nr:hypothetical protein [Acetobacteraceae bacterium H6797]
MNRRLLVSSVLGLGLAGIWLWANGPGTSLPGAIVAWILAAAGFMAGWKLLRPKQEPVEDTGPPSPSTHPYGPGGKPGTKGPPKPRV